jgi:hypothetical protein
MVRSSYTQNPLLVRSGFAGGLMMILTMKMDFLPVSIVQFYQNFKAWKKHTN